MEEWIFYSIFALFISSSIIIIMKYLGTQINSDEIKSFLCLSLVITGIISFFYLLTHKKNIYNIIKKKNHSLLILLAFIFAILLLFNYITQIEAHNKCKIGGLPLIIINLNIIIVILISSFLYNTQLNFNSILGIFLIISGLSLVILNN